MDVILLIHDNLDSNGVHLLVEIQRPHSELRELKLISKSTISWDGGGGMNKWRKNRRKELKNRSHRILVYEAGEGGEIHGHSNVGSTIEGATIDPANI
jgi:hypothetical protein